MAQVGAWAIDGDDPPQRLSRDQNFLERDLEDWIERDPELLSSDLRLVARQLPVPAGQMDLLGYTRDGTWVVIELKREAVGTWTVLQAMYYFAQLSNMTNHELLRRIEIRGLIDESLRDELIETMNDDPENTHREYLLMVAGVGAGESAEQAVATLTAAGFRVPVRVVTLQLVSNGDGRRVLLREIDDEVEPGPKSNPVGWSVDAVLERAATMGVRDELAQIHEDLRLSGYNSYPRKHGFNANDGSKLQTFWIRPKDGAIHIGYLSDNFPKLFGIDEETAKEKLGQNWVSLPPDAAVETMRRWVREINGLINDKERGDELQAPAAS